MDKVRACVDQIEVLDEPWLFHGDDDQRSQRPHNLEQKRN